MYVLLFLFKQKTAYEMRISDWSSDVCSSDLTERTRHGERVKHKLAVGEGDAFRVPRGARRVESCCDRVLVKVGEGIVCRCPGRKRFIFALGPVRYRASSAVHDRNHGLDGWRSEEHTSELQSLMRHSYAVFCLKKKKN